MCPPALHIAPRRSCLSIVARRHFRVAVARAVGLGHAALMHSSLCCRGLLALLAAMSAGCPSLSGTPRILIGRVVDDAGNLVRPTRVSIPSDEGEVSDCWVDFGSFRCDSRRSVDTLRVERGADVYTEQISVDIADCPEGCDLQRSFVVANAPDGACNTDTLPLVGRLVSAGPDPLGVITNVVLQAPAGLSFVSLPAADPVGSSETAGPNEWLLYVDPRLTSDTTLVLQVWCDAHGARSASAPRSGFVMAELRPTPGDSDCAYDPVELRVGPNDIVKCG